jgi:hypothetical protein
MVHQPASIPIEMGDELLGAFSEDYNGHELNSCFRDV